MNDQPHPPHEFCVQPAEGGERLDAYLRRQLPQYSRTLLRRAIDSGYVTVDDCRTKVAYRLLPGQRVNLQTIDLPSEGPLPEPMPLEVIFEDEWLVVINKRPGVVVHPAKGHWKGTLAAGLIHHFQQLSSLGGAARPGIVHRLDRDTSGVMVVAKNDVAHANLAAQFEARTTIKEYLAICRNAPDRDRDRIRLPIGPHPHHRAKMAIRAEHASSRPAVTEYVVEHRFIGFCRIRALPKTGRTHQIRVHLAHLGCPVVCDRLYGGHDKLTVGEICHSAEETVLLDRQALHALRLQLDHPRSGQRMAFEAPLPDDMRRLQELLESHRRNAAAGRV